MKKSEITKIEAYLRRTLGSDKLRVVSRPTKTDSADVVVGQGKDEEFVGVVFVDDEDGDRSFNFQMSILAEDLSD
ncbi:MAG: DUF3126 family protein [Methylobacteriaceae bacterium]|nr:DUF3126 family protein [Methylobacteriaceae bacterium]